MGIEPLPVQAQHDEVTEMTRARLWAIILDWILSGCERYDPSRFVRGKPYETLLRWWVNYRAQMIDEMPRYGKDWQTRLKAEMQGDYLSVFNLVQFLLSDSSFTRKTALSEALEDTNAAYRVSNGLLHRFVSEEETVVVKEAVQMVDAVGATGAKTHLKAAAAELTNGHWGSAAHESISAVESAARFAVGDDSLDLSSAVSRLRREEAINHTALAELIKKLYGYANDAKGVRHSLGSDDPSPVGESEAMLVFGISASAITYLLRIKPE